ncbi:hypothetical protein C0J52_23990 [Blattella germanica]|nr:hypothetical protein C0J52_23990 [Blattella germanica]
MEWTLVLLWIVELRTPTSLGMCCGVGKCKMVTNAPPATGCAFPPWPAPLPSHTYACPPATCLLRCMTFVGSVRAPSYSYGASKCSLLDTLPVCQDFNRQLCNRPACKFVHLQEGHVEVVDMKVTVCRDAVKGKCVRPLCKYYHIPIPLPPANEMAAQLEDQGQFSTTPSAAIVAATRTSVTVSSGNPNRMLCQQVFGFNS